MDRPGPQPGGRGQCGERADGQQCGQFALGVLDLRVQVGQQPQVGGQHPTAMQLVAMGDGLDRRDGVMVAMVWMVWMVWMVAMVPNHPQAYAGHALQW
jgi:hypothetical protein